MPGVAAVKRRAEESFSCRALPRSSALRRATGRLAARFGGWHGEDLVNTLEELLDLPAVAARHAVPQGGNNRLRVFGRAPLHALSLGRQGDAARTAIPGMGFTANGMPLLQAPVDSCYRDRVRADPFHDRSARSELTVKASLCPRECRDHGSRNRERCPRAHRAPERMCQFAPLNSGVACLGFHRPRHPRVSAVPRCLRALTERRRPRTSRLASPARLQSEGEARRPLRRCSTSVTRGPRTLTRSRKAAQRRGHCSHRPPGV
jgi:hypothetical protein